MTTNNRDPVARAFDWLRKPWHAAIVVAVVLAVFVVVAINGNSGGSSSSTPAKSPAPAASSGDWYQHGYNFVSQLADDDGDSDGYLGSGQNTPTEFCEIMQLASQTNYGPGTPVGTNNGQSVSPGLPGDRTMSTPAWETAENQWMSGCEASYSAVGG